MIRQGDTYTHEVSFTQEQVNEFAKVTGDCNPIHINADYAAKTPFGRPIVHGFFAGSVFSKVFGMFFPGEGTIYMSQEMKFRGPVFVGQPYKALFEVVEVNTEKHNAIVRTTLVNEQGNICIEGSAKLKHTREFI